MTDDELRQAYQTGVGPAAEPRARCPSPDAIAALVNRQGSEADRLALLDHVMSCGGCRRDFELLRSVTRAGEGTGVPRRWLVLAASIALVVGGGAVAVGALGRSAPDVFRGGAAGVVLLGPARGSATAKPVVLRWHAVSGARSYRVELLAQNGSPIGSWSTADTTLALADSLPLHSRESYGWWVRAQLADGSERVSAVTPFSVR